VTLAGVGIAGGLATGLAGGGVDPLALPLAGADTGAGVGSEDVLAGAGDPKTRCPLAFVL